MNTTISLKAKKQAGEKISCLTVYDASFAEVLEDVGVDLFLVGDSLGMVVQGQKTTLPVSIEEMIYHAQSVRRGAPNSFIMVDLPFMSYSSVELALKNAGEVMKKSGANMVKLEGGGEMFDVVEMLSSRGIPVCAHLGLLPQSVHKTGGYRVQGKSKESAQKMIEEAVELERVGADILVLECVPSSLAKQISQNIEIPVIGIGAGVDCDGQVLVLYDMLDISIGHRPKFSKNFLEGRASIRDGVQAYVDAVKAKEFPALEHSF